MLPLLLFSILSVSCIIERLIFWNKLNNKKLINDLQINQFTDIAYLQSLKKRDIGNNPYKKLLFKIKDFDFSPVKNGYAIKIPVFSFEKFPNVNKELGPEMKSTGEAIQFIKDLKDPFFRKVYSERNLYLSK